VVKDVLNGKVYYRGGRLPDGEDSGGKTRRGGGQKEMMGTYGRLEHSGRGGISGGRISLR